MDRIADPGRAKEIAANLAAVRERIGRAAALAGRAQDSVRLIAVTKRCPPADVRAAAEAGQTEFGENRIEEAVPKIEAAGSGLFWHMIGHVQSRKAAQVARTDFSLIHSVDTLRLARRLSESACGAGVRRPVLLECNTSGEASKAGFAASQPAGWQALVPLFGQIAELEGVQIRGLMTMAPLAAPADAVRACFAQLRQLSDYLREQVPSAAWEHLSMGMTDDFELAIAEGATLVRVGRAIFGERG